MLAAFGPFHSLQFILTRDTLFPAQASVLKLNPYKSFQGWLKGVEGTGCCQNIAQRCHAWTFQLLCGIVLWHVIGIFCEAKCSRIRQYRMPSNAVRYTDLNRLPHVSTNVRRWEYNLAPVSSGEWKSPPSAGLTLRGSDKRRKDRQESWCIVQRQSPTIDREILGGKTKHSIIQNVEQTLSACFLPHGTGKRCHFCTW